MIEPSFMKSLFHGIIAEGMLFPFPSPSPAEADSLNIILDSVGRYCTHEVDSAKIDRDQRIPAEVLGGLKELGLFGMVIPAEYGGIGLSATGYTRVMERLGAHDASITATIRAHQSIGLQAILAFGTEEQKRRFLPRLATGEQVAAFALTEPGAGSDAAAIRTRAELASDGTHWVLNGSKIWITNGGIADVFTVFARTSPGEEGRKAKLTAFIVERSEGLKSGPNEKKLGIRGCSTAALFFDDLRVPVENVIGEPGRGLKVALAVLDSGRVGLAAGCIGACKTVIKLAIDRAQERKAFGRSIGEFGLIKDKIATMVSETYAAESMVYLTTGLVDAGVADYALESAIAKVFSSEVLWRSVDETLQIAAGIGFMQGYPYERLLRDARISLIYEGTNEVLRGYIALSGMRGPTDAMSELARAMREPIKGFGQLSEFARRRARSALGRERLSRVHPTLGREAHLFEEKTGDFARCVETAVRRHGADLPQMQYLQRRVANMAIDLYAIAAVLARTTRSLELHGAEGARREVDLTTLFVNAAKKRLEDAVTAFDDNDDDLRKAAAAKSYVDGRYPFDIL